MLRCGVLFLVALFATGSPLRADADKGTGELETVLRDLVKEHLAASQAEDLDRVMDTFHTQSPSYLPTRNAMKELLPLYDLRFTLKDFRVIGRDEPYAIARVKLLTQKTAGLAFKDNLQDAFWVFRQENGRWKLWTQATLETQFIEKSADSE